MATSLVTGGAGFIGSHLVEHLLELGDEVIVLDDLSTGSVDNLATVSAHDRLHLDVGSVLEKARVDRLVNRSDRVFHLAAAVGVDLIVKQPAQVIETNIIGTECVLSACAEQTCPVFVASTSEVYGKSTAAPFSEDDDLVLGSTSKSRWSYACSKAIDEFLALAYVKSRGLPAVVGRFFNTTGPRQTGRYGMVIPRFVDQALHGDPITVYGTGQQVRCFAHVRDIVPAVVRLLECEDARGSVVNLGTRERITILELARRVCDVTNSGSEIVYVPFEEAYEGGFEDIESREPDISRAEALIGFRPRHGLTSILEDVVESRRGR